MKWFKVDTDMPDDPRILEVLGRLGNEGLGALVRLWCYVANHGKKPGYAVDSQRRPLKKQALIQASGLPEEKFSDLMTVLAENGHLRKRSWRKSGLLIFPAMVTRADVYTQRHVRTKFAHNAKFVSLEEKRREEKYVRARARVGLSPNKATNGKAKTRGTRCPHQPMCPSITACIDRTVTEARHAQKRKG